MRSGIKSVLPLLVLIGTVMHSSPAQTGPAENLQSLAREFFAWRAVTQPSTYDDVNRVERPDDWVPDWSPAALAQYEQKQVEFRNRVEALDPSGWSLADSIDALLLRSAIARVNYELNVVRSARRNPDFYVQQTLGAVYELLLQPPPFDERRSRNIVLRLEAIPRTLHHATSNLTEQVAAFAGIAVRNLARIEEQLELFERSLTPLLDRSYQRRFRAAVRTAVPQLVSYRHRLKTGQEGMKGSFAIGKEAYERFLHQVALIPLTSEQIVTMGAAEWERSVAFHQFEHVRTPSMPEPVYFSTAAEQIQAQQKAEEAVRRFLVEKRILDIPSWMGRYKNLKIPDYIRALSWLGVTDDLTSASRLGEDGVRYIFDPGPHLPFFHRSMAEDPRPIIVHEGVPGHYFQLSMSRSHPNEIRRHFFDSGPIEGIGFYVEEMLLQSGLFEDNPRTRATIYHYMRLRALRVEVDVKLATGAFSIADAARYLEQVVPLDRATAEQEAAFFAATPGQAISYQIGKMQIVRLVADARVHLGERFSLRDLHNALMLNGNVPVALVRAEFLQAREELQTLWESK